MLGAVYIFEIALALLRETEQREICVHEYHQQSLSWSCGHAKHTVAMLFPSANLRYSPCIFEEHAGA